VAAFTTAQLFPDATLQEKGWHKAASEQEVWIGTHSNGEVPLTWKEMISHRPLHLGAMWLRRRQRRIRDR
jgi:hypothetical protein